VAVKIIEHSAETSSDIKELRESVLSSSIIHPNVVSTYKIRTIPAACPNSCQAYAQVWLSPFWPVHLTRHKRAPDRKDGSDACCMLHWLLGSCRERALQQFMIAACEGMDLRCTDMM